MKRFPSIACGLIVGMFFTMTASGEPIRFKQDRFAIGFWYDPPADKNMEQSYADIAAANFTLVISGYGASTAEPETIQRQIKLCEKHDLKALVAMGGLPPEKLPESPAVWGYTVIDEPSAKLVPELRKTVEGIRQARPGKLAYINLFPNWTPKETLGSENYDEHVRQFVEDVGVDVLSMDHYPAMNPDKDTRDNYCANLDVMRKFSLKQDIPFWNFFIVMPYLDRYDPTEAQLRWQIFSSLVYGAKGVLYFCYWTPPGEWFLKGGAIITAEGRKTRHYEQAKRINANLKNLGPTLMKLTSTDVRRVKPGEDAGDLLKGTPIKGLTGDDYLVGVFKHADGRRAVLLNNYNFSYTAWPTVEFDVPVGKVREVCQATGKEIPIVDDSPAMEGLQVSLDSAEGRLFILPPQKF